jgi:hypothetical protein
MRWRVPATSSRQNYFIHRVARTLHVRESKQDIPVCYRTYNFRSTQRLGVRIHHRTHASERLGSLSKRASMTQGMIPLSVPLDVVGQSEGPPHQPSFYSVTFLGKVKGVSKGTL